MIKSELDINKEKLGQRIESLRTLKDYGVREFALLAEIEHHQLINIEKGRVDPRYSTLIKISKALEIEIKELLNF
ncbi:helix-turn-helix transcriptional regulator [Pedobacter sp. UBA4863]|uniref:helix-turn-helix domain-containing protein n=1 Tax=Pedobacter sp. UBA4863 TaxID=1947060 RepID=UPI0025F6D46B|nr:helix-turn-helix transcriptional regulator [Pedobacter sp. UBA4863]